MKEAALIGLMGVTLGLIAAAVASELLDSLLYGIAPTDPATHFGVAAALFVLVVAASLAPASRAAAADPMRALRAE